MAGCKYPNKPNYKKVLEMANDVLENNFIDLPPVNARELAENYGLSVNFKKFPDEMSQVCGFIDFNDNKMYVNADDSTSRQNFTIAHELGHWLLHRNEIMNNLNSYKILMRQPIGGESDPIEKEANTFAANLLVPKNMLKRLMKNGFNKTQLSDIFAVSEQVINYRLNKEGC